MARVTWSRYPGNEVESVVGILLSREHPAATRIKPSQGDGGIDILVPSAEGLTIYQVKGFTGNLTSTQKSHIENSWHRFLGYKGELSAPVIAWHLVMPENPTKEQLKWLDGVCKTTDFATGWQGLDFVDGLASKFQDVIDYYFGDGQERLEETVKTFLRITSPNRQGTLPVESFERLEELHKALNSFDPHFSYDFSVDTLSPGGLGPDLATAPRPGMVGAAQASDGERCVTFRIMVRYARATEDRPVPGGFTLVAPNDSELAEAIEDFFRFGTPVANVPATNVHVDLPGGLGAEPHDALVSLGPHKVEGVPPAEFTLKILDPVGDVVAQLDIRTHEVTTGVTSAAIRAACSDMAASVLHCEIRIDKEKMTHVLNLRVESFVGRRPADLIPVVTFLNALRPGRKLAIWMRGGPQVAAPSPIEGAMASEEVGALNLRICRDLATIQEHSLQPILLPELSDLDSDAFDAWNEVAALLRGEELSGTWDGMALTVPAGTDVVEDQMALLLNEKFGVRVGNQLIEVGYRSARFASWRVDPANPPTVLDGEIHERLIPGDDDTVLLRYAGPSESPLAWPPLINPLA